MIWSPEALTDLDTIWDYYAAVAGPHTADNVIWKIAEACVPLEAHPFAGRARHEIRPGLISLLAHPYVIFHRVRNDTAEIVRVIDGRRDIDSIFAD